MGLFNKIAKWGFSSATRRSGKKSAEANRRGAENRRCRFESMEERRMLDADPVIAGITYLEGDTGEDTGPDYFEVTFQGGGQTTQLTQFVINGDQDGSGGLSQGDMFFDHAAGGPGAAGFHPFEFDAANSNGITAEDIVSVEYANDGLQLIVTLRNFEAGDKLAFTVDVDEVETLRDDKIASGVEFEGTLFTATFADQYHTFESRDFNVPHTLENGAIQNQQTGIFYDEYDDLFAAGNGLLETPLNLKADNAELAANRTDGSIVAYDLVEKPITISGQVYHDENADCHRDADEQGIANVTLKLQLLNSSNGQYETVATTTTDDNGFYEFGLDLDLKPGTYRIIETQPEGFLSVGAQAGEVSGNTTGTVGNDEAGEPNVIGDIVIPNGGDVAVNYDFCEVLPASLSGHVWHDLNNDGVRDPGEDPIAQVLITVTRLGSKDGNPNDPFQDMEPITVVTDANGFYQVDLLPPGLYEIVEISNYPADFDPLAGFIDGKDSLGSIGGVPKGFKSNDQFSGIELCAGDAGINYDFGEIQPVLINGYVSITDVEGHCLDPTDPNYQGIEGVVIELYDAEGNFIDVALTDADGFYEFTQLPPGGYTIVQVQPDGFVDAGQDLGSAGGVIGDNRFSEVNLLSGAQGLNYNFCEHQYGSIDGFVHTEHNGNKTLDLDAGEIALEGVVVQLLDGDGNVIAQTTTDADGYYRFDNLLPGQYGLREIQPTDYLDVGAIVGSDQATGETGSGTVGENEIIGIQIGSGQNLVRYNFCEAEPARIQGRVWHDGPNFRTEDGALPANYRDQRDGIYQSGVDTPISGVRMYLYFMNDLAGGSVNPVPVTLDSVLAEYYPHLDGQPGDTPVWIDTDANGEYVFDGLPAGNFIVLQTQPEGYADANDIVGSTTGFTFNSELEASLAPSALANTFSNGQLMDSVAGIQVQAGGVSVQNNFTEVRVEQLPDEPPENPPPTSNPPPTFNPPGSPTPPGGPGLNLYRHQGPFQSTVVGGRVAIGVDAAPLSESWTWHLSVVNGGNPRGEGQSDDGVWMQASFLSEAEWARQDMDDSLWSFAKFQPHSGELEIQDRTVRFGMLDGIPLAGDFNGDGIDEIAVYRNGFWYLDIDGNGTWEREDLVAQLGSDTDQPVVGDWDGDGKDDIGIFGPRWLRDDEAIAREPGLPNPDNDARLRPKNLPPASNDATEGVRVMRLASYGKSRADLIDHVFEYGDEEDIAITGDWNGNGIRSIGIFRGGQWQLDVDGNGQLDASDQTARFGRSGDQPVVGDFDGDGIEEIGVYRNGTWIIDTNGNQELDATDRVFEMGSAGDQPVVGDWDGDGVDDPATVRFDVTSNWN